MKNTFKIFIFIVTMAFLVISCQRNLPVPALEEVQYETTAYVQEVVPYVIAEVEIERFTPLNDNERFAFSMHSVRLSPVRWQPHITIYAVRDDNIEEASELFTWAIQNKESVQFTSDLRQCFIRVDTRPFGIYRVNGSAGEIRRVLSIDNPNFRVSMDGRFILFQSYIRNREFAHLFLFDVESESIISEFEWRPNITASSWSINRFGEVFKIYAVNELGEIEAVGTLNLVTRELRTLWNDFSIAGLSSRPSSYDDEDWYDDVSIQRMSPSVMLRR